MKNFSKLFFFTLFSVVLLTQTGCYLIEKNTENATEAYKLWSVEEPPKEIQVLNGKYWQSSHWTKEYILYLNLIAPSEWREAFIKQNNLVEIETVIGLPPDAPDWFKPTSDYKAFVSGDSIYYEDPESGRVFLYDIQL